MDVVRPVMAEFPWAWAFFVPFIVITSFAVLNLFIALIVNSLQAIHDAEVESSRAEAQAEAHDERVALSAEIQAMRTELSALREDLKR